MSETVDVLRTPARPASPTMLSWIAFGFALSALLVLALVLPHGEMGPSGRMELDPVTKKSVFVHDERPFRSVGAMLGELSFTLLIASVLVAYPVPWVRSWSLTKRIVAHAVLGVLILVLGIAHAGLLAFDQSYRGWLPGALSLAAFVAHGTLAMLRVHLTRAWGSQWWRFAHHASAWAAFALTIEHILLASWHMGLAKWFHDAGWS